MNLSAESIALSLDKGRRVTTDRYTACCPAHADKTPSLSITQAPEKVLLYCHSGCSQSEVIDALLSRGLWTNEKKLADVHTLVDHQEIREFCLAHEYNLKSNLPTSSKHKRLYRQFLRILCYPFNPEEIAEMDLYCRIYRDCVRAGSTPTPEENETFMLYQSIALTMEVIPYGW